MQKFSIGYEGSKSQRVYISRLDGKRGNGMVKVITGSRRYYIQSSYAVPTGEKRMQETQSFRRIGDGFKRILIQNGSVVPWHDDNGILTISLTDFLLKPESLDW